MFADYRVPQVLNAMGCMFYAPILDTMIREKKMFESGGQLETQLRGKFTTALPSHM